MNQINKLIEIALNEVGYKEKKSNRYLDSKNLNAGSGNYTKYARDLDNIKDFYNGKKQGYAWCDVFVDWCFVKAFGTNIAKKLLYQPDNSLGAGVLYSRNYFKNNKQYYNKPHIGDQIFFKKGNIITHTGLVYKVDNNYVYTIEGNTYDSNLVVSNGESVCKKKYKLNSSFIDGYGRPNYQDIINEETIITGKIVKYVNDVDYEGLVVHKSINGPNTGDILPLCTKVYVYETKNNWSKIGENKWVYSTYLKDTKPKVKTVTGADSEGLNVRQTRSIKNNKPITCLKNGTLVQVFKTMNGWSKISPDNEAWVVSKYLK